MATPEVIDTGLTMDPYSSVHNGPFEKNGYLYGIFYDDMNGTFEAWRATTSAVTAWSEVDAANHLVEWTAATNWVLGAYDVFKSGDLLYVAYLKNGGGGALSVAVFNLASGAWVPASEVNAGPTPSTALRSYYPRWKLMVLSNGRYRIALNQEDGTPAKLVIRLYEYASSAWSLLNTVFTRVAAGTGYYDCAILTMLYGDNDDGVVIAATNARHRIYAIPIQYTPISGDHSPSGEIAISNIGVYACGPPIRYTNGDNKTVVGFTVMSDDSTWHGEGFPGFAYALADNYGPFGRLAPDFRVDYNQSCDDNTMSLSIDSGCPIAAVWKSSTLYLIWFSDNYNGIVYTSNKGKWWTVPPLAASSTGWSFGNSMSAESITAGIGLFVAGAGQVYYHEFVPTSAAEECAAAASGARYSIT